MNKKYIQKAKLALSLTVLKQVKNCHQSQEKIVRFLSPDFTWSLVNIGNSQKIWIQYNIHPSCWIIQGNIEHCFHLQNCYSIDISTNSNFHDLLLPKCKIQLVANGFNNYLFTAIWKAFEEKLREVIGIADLVQFSGYYQYHPRIQTYMSFAKSVTIEPCWRVVQCAVNGQGISQQMPAEQLSELWHIPPADLLFYLQNLKNLGYEVRNHHTNPQIPQNHYLIPYHFPTLTPHSIQLYKSLS